MKNMNNFAAQQLSKKQMNEVKGGQSRSIKLWECKWSGENNYTIIQETEFKKLAEDAYISGIKEINCRPLA